MPARPFVRRFALALGLAAGTAISSPVIAQGNAPFTVVESGQSYMTLQAAVDAIGNGSGTIAIAPGTHRQCAVQNGGAVSYMATKPGTAIFDTVTCQGKAALVLKGRDAKVSGLVFRNMAVPDFNGAGIRLEKGDLTVSQSWFADSQQGILTGNNPNGRIVIDKSTFSGLGTCEGKGGCAHSIYTGEYGHLRITRSRFEKGAGGHYVKSRCAKVEIASNSFDDSKGHQTNYMIDLPNGAVGQITNNWFVQGASKENYSAMITFGAKATTNTSNGFVLAGNDARLAPGARNTVFVADWTGDAIDISDNTIGAGIKKHEKR